MYPLLPRLQSAAAMTAVMAALSVLVLYACLNFKKTPVARMTIKSIFQNWLVFVPCWGVAFGLHYFAHFSIIVCAWWGVFVFIVEMHLLEKYINSKWATTPSIHIPTPDDLASLDPDMPDEDWTCITGDAFTFLTRIKATGLNDIQLARAAQRDEVRLIQIQFLNWCEVLLSAASELDFANRYSSYLESVAGIYAPQILNSAYGAEYDEDRHIIRSFAQENGLEKIAHAFYAIWFVHAGRPRYISGPHE